MTAAPSVPSNGRVAKAPCKSCPYRCDVPSGVWAAEEYERLPAFDGDIPEQLMAGATYLFMCHQDDGHICAGWVACHGPENLLALRLHGAAERLDPSVWDYVSPVPVFASGREACDHGKRDLDEPSAVAARTVARIKRKRNL